MPEVPKVTHIPKIHKKALEFIENATSNPDPIQKQVLSQILTQNACAEYLHRFNIFGPAIDAFHRHVPVVSYEDIEPDIQRIANGDRSPIFSSHPVSEFLTSSGTSGGERKLMPTIAEEMDRRSFFYSLQMPVMSQFVPNLDKGKAMYFHFIKSESVTPSGLVARPVLTSYYKSKHFTHRAFDPFSVYTSPTEAVLCTDSEQSMYAQLLCGLFQSSQVVRVGSVFASGFIRAIRVLQSHWPRFCHDIRTGTLDPVVTDKPVRAAVEEMLHPDPKLADFIESECKKDSWKGIIQRIWPNTKYIEVIVTGTMSQYIPTLDYYSNGLPLACTMYGSSECYFGLNLNPMCKPSEVAYTLIPTMAYFEFLPANKSESFDKKDLVGLADVKLGHEYELVVTTYSGLYRYRVGDVLRVAGFKNKSPQFTFVRRKNVALSIDSDKTDEVELHDAISNAVTHLAPFGASVTEYTSYADTSTVPGHYVLYWEMKHGMTVIPPSVFEDCCLTVEESLNSVYRQGRTSDKSIGPLEIRIVEEGSFDVLMDFALAQGASINQYKAPRCLKSEKMIELMNERVIEKFFSPKCPKWVCGHKQWIKEIMAPPSHVPN